MIHGNLGNRRLGCDALGEWSVIEAIELRDGDDVFHSGDMAYFHAKQ